MDEKTPAMGSALENCIRAFQTQLLAFQQQLDHLLPTTLQPHWQRSLAELSTQLEELANAPDKTTPDFLPPYSEIQWIALSACLPVGIFTCDLDGNCTYLNRRCIEIIGCAPEEALGDRWLSFVHPDDRDRVLTSLKIANQTAKPYTEEFRFQRPPEKMRWLYLRKAPIFSEQGELIGYTGTVEDITKQKLTEEQIKASLYEKEALLKEIHHRVKNNLQIISSLIYLQSQRIEDVSVRQIFEDSQSRISSMALVHDSLYRSQDFACVDLSEYVQMLTANLFQTYRIQPDLVKLLVNVDEGVVVSLDRAIPCGLILNELMTNALKHGFSNGQTGEITVILKSHHLAIHLIVENDGNSLPESFELQKIRSMGLRLVNALVSQLHGQFEVEKTAKTRFKVTFNRT
jgi:PAS domain S-box-containing protein